MTSMVFGEVDWNSADSGTKSDFIRLEEGENTVRVMGNPVQFYIHWVVTPDGSRRIKSDFVPESAEFQSTSPNTILVIFLS